MSITNRILVATLISTIGNWLTFIAIALLVGERFGVNQVAFVFLIESLPALFLSRGLTELIPTDKKYEVYIGLQVFLAASLVILMFDPSLAVIYGYLIVTSVLKSMTNPLVNSLIGAWVDEDSVASVHTRVGAINASALALAPMLGGWLAIQVGYTWLFTIDAFTFLMVIVVLLPKPGRVYANAKPEKTRQVSQFWRILTPIWKPWFASLAALSSPGRAYSQATAEAPSDYGRGIVRPGSKHRQTTVEGSSDYSRGIVRLRSRDRQTTVEKWSGYVRDMVAICPG